jgi:hypothetical protein
MSKTITVFDKTNLRSMQIPIELALQAIETEFGISVKLGNARFTPDNATFKLELSTLNANGQAVTKEANDLKTYGTLYGLPANALGQTFIEYGKKFEITGLRTKASRYPVLVKRVIGGKVFCYPAERVANALKVQDLLAKLK